MHFSRARSRGLTCTRTLFVDADVPTADVSVAVDRGMLCVRVPHAQAEPSEEDATGVTLQEEEEFAADMEIELEGPLKDKLLHGHADMRTFYMDKENRSAQPDRSEPLAMEWWSEEELQRESEAMPPVCVLAT